MTVKELFSNVEFDQLLPYLKKLVSRHPDRIYSFREAYDRLRDMEPDKDFVDDVCVLTDTDDDGEKYTEVLCLDEMSGKRNWPKHSFSQKACKSAWKNLLQSAYGISLTMGFRPDRERKI